MTIIFHVEIWLIFALLGDDELLSYSWNMCPNLTFRLNQNRTRKDVVFGGCQPITAYHELTNVAERCHCSLVQDSARVMQKSSHSRDVGTPLPRNCQSEPGLNLVSRLQPLDIFFV